MGVFNSYKTWNWHFPHIFNFLSERKSIFQHCRYKRGVFSPHALHYCHFIKKQCHDASANFRNSSHFYNLGQTINSKNLSSQFPLSQRVYDNDNRCSSPLPSVSPYLYEPHFCSANLKFCGWIWRTKTGISEHGCIKIINMKKLKKYRILHF